MSENYVLELHKTHEGYRLHCMRGHETIKLDFTELEISGVFTDIMKYFKSVEKHRSYYDSDAKVHIIHFKKGLKYNCSVKVWQVRDTITNENYELTDEESAKRLVDLLRDKYRI